MSKIIIDNSTEQLEIVNHSPAKGIVLKPNLFIGRTEAELGKTRFPDWDIVPPNQFINPRIKHK